MERRRIRRADISAIMESARKTFGDGNAHGVLGFGIDRKVIAGRRVSERALNVYVAHKQATPDQPVAPLEVPERDLVVVPNVVGIGPSPNAHDSGFKPPMTGVYAGAAIHSEATIKQFGGVAAVLGNGPQEPTHLLTSGHLFSAGGGRVAVTGGVPGSAQPQQIGTLELNLLDGPQPDGTAAIDAALVQLTPAGASAAVASTEGPRLREDAPDDELFSIEVLAFLPTTHDRSNATTTQDGPTDVFMTSPARGTYAVRGVVATRSLVTNPGDSGTIFIDETNSGIALGICVGQLGTTSIFEPFDRALRFLRQLTGHPLNFIF